MIDNESNRTSSLSPEPALGLVVGGSLSHGVEIRLDPDGAASVEDLKAGSFVTIHGNRHKFFGVVTDLTLDNADPRIKHNPPPLDNPFIAEVVSGTVAYGTAEVIPHLTMPLVIGNPDVVPVASKTIPSHFSPAYPASDSDVETVFGKEDDQHFWIGNPLDMQTKLCLNLEELVKRSIGVFGKSGTGKTFLTRLLLVGILQGNQASSLIFDMHNEYGWQGTSESSTAVKGLKQLFGAQVAVFSLDAESSRRRGFHPDYQVEFGYSDIDPEDIQLLRETLDLSNVAADAAYALESRFGRGKWFGAFVKLRGEDINNLATEINVASSALSALRRRLERLIRFDFVSQNDVADSADSIIKTLRNGKHVVLEFGKHGNNPTAYMLVANILTRRIYERYQSQKEEALGGGADVPPYLVITIEEAHRFLGSSMASQTIFGTIAREMRKYNVTLLVVDQRPSDIDEEVMSQIGTKVVCLLDSGRDIDSVLSGVSGNRKLRSVLSRLDSRQQAIIFGHSVPMPVVIRTRDYGSAESYSEFMTTNERTAEGLQNKLEDLYGPSD